MHKLLLFVCLVLVYITCVKENVIPLNNPATELIDRGIYQGDSLHSDGFCDFRILKNEGNCWNEMMTVSEDCHYNLLFTRYGNGWTGADATYSMPLPDGRIMWMFGDTFLGSVRSDRTRDGTPLLRNTLVIQEGDELVTLFQGKGTGAKAFVSPANEHEWYWPLDATVYSGKIQWMLGRLGSSGVGGNWDFKYVGFDLAILDISDFSIEKLYSKVDDPDISYGSCVLEDDDYIYIYGISSRPFQKRAHLARAKDGDLTNAWEYFDGRNWGEKPSSYVIQKGVSDQFSVIKEGHTYYLITHEIIFGNKIFIMESDAPTGPFVNKRVLYCTPENSEKIFTYNSFVHPEMSKEGELRLSYNINSFDFSLLFENADLYRPKFIRIDHWK